jgi:hypothetical protein
MPKKKSTPPGKHLKMPNVAAPPVGRAVDTRTLVVQALEDPRYDWRTLDGLVRATRISENDILALLNSMRDQIVRATTADGRTVFTTRNHYEKTHGFGDKLLSALADKVVA